MHRTHVMHSPKYVQMYMSHLRYLTDTSLWINVYHFFFLCLWKYSKHPQSIHNHLIMDANIFHFENLDEKKIFILYTFVYCLYE